MRGQPCTWDLRLIITPGVKAVNTTPHGKQALEVHRSKTVQTFIHMRRMS